MGDVRLALEGAFESATSQVVPMEKYEVRLYVSKGPKE